jgi:hypothetical protein
MRLFRLTGVSALAAFASLSISACGETAGPEGEAQDFSGSYTLHSISQGTVTNVIVLPGATGTFTMTATTYQVSIDYPALPDPITDTGTYTATGTATSGTFTQASTSGASLQYQGTYAWDGATNRLTLDTTSGNTRTVLVIQKT